VANVNLKSVHKVRAKGKTYYYAWRGAGAPRLTSKPGTPAFIEELNDALASRTRGDETKFSGLIAAYKASDDFQGLAASTKEQWLRWLDIIRDEFGNLSIRQFDQSRVKAEIVKWHRTRKSKPRAADYGLQVLSRVLSFGVAEGKLTTNACTGIKWLYDVDRSDQIWEPDNLKKLLDAASKEMKFAVRLALATGMRRGDLLRVSWNHVNAEFIELKTGKSRGKRTVTVPLTQELRQLLAEIPKKATTILTSSREQPWTGDGFGSSWWKTLADAGLSKCGLHFHDLRGTAATRFYRAGLSEREIAVTMGWSEKRVSALIDMYVRKDDILRDRARRIDNLDARGVTEVRSG
jgi:integrase